MKNSCLKYLLGLVASCAAAAAPVSPPPPPEANGPARTVEQLLNSPHGLQGPARTQLQPLVDRIQKDPSAYIPLLLQRLETARIAGDDESARQAEIASALLVRACGEPGRDAAAERFIELAAKAQQTRERLAPQHPKDEKTRLALIDQSRAAGRMLTVARKIATDFADARDARLRDPLISGFSTTDYSTKLVYLQYFKAATPDDAKVKEMLRPLYESPRSEFYRSPAIGALLGKPRDSKKP